MADQAGDLEARLHGAMRAAWARLGATPCARTGRTVGEALPASMPFAPESARAMAVDGMPVLGHLDTALAVASGELGEEAIAPLAAVAHHLSWTRSPAYTLERVGARFLASYGYGLMTGPEGPLRTPAPRAGLLLLAPHFVYPDHCHPPREAYLVLTPGARWRLDRGGWFPVAAGTVIHHASNQWHAMGTGEAPFLAFVAWLDPACPGEIDI